jgi:hypothetical protein
MSAFQVMQELETIRILRRPHAQIAFCVCRAYRVEGGIWFLEQTRLTQCFVVCIVFDEVTCQIDQSKLHQCLEIWYK